MKNCIICKKDSKYKCPNCTVNYCSAKCFQSHKSKECSPPISTEDITFKGSSNKEEEYFTKDTVPLQKLQLLEGDKHLKELLKNPHLREFIKEIDKATNPVVIMEKAMMEPIFIEFVDACLNVVENKDSL